jgi:hypothetical protein
MASARLHGEALLLGQRPEVKALAAELRALSESGPDAAALRAECAGIIAGSWFAEGIKYQGHPLIAAGLLISCGPVDNDALIEWVAEGQRRAKMSWTANDF